jgi:acetyl esterase/lipase
MTELTGEALTYRVVDGVELAGQLYRPARPGPAPYVIEVHGGAWMSNDRFRNVNVHRHLVVRGIGVFAIDFRLSSQAKYPGPVSDVSHAIRWFKRNAPGLGIEVGLLAGLGFSSGGQQLGMVALRPDGPDYTAADPALAGVDASVDLFLACWPVLDPVARYAKVRAEGNQRLVDATLAYFADEAAMAAGSPYGLLERGEATHRPPMLIVQGTEDTNVDHGRADIFADAYRAAGGEAVVHKYPGQPHAFSNADPDGAATRDAFDKLGDFVLAHA